MAYYQNGVLSRPAGGAEEPGGLLQWPGETDFSGPVGGDVSDLSLVPELDASTPALWQAFGPSTPQRTAQAGAVSIPWLLIGGLAIAVYALASRR